MNSHLFQRIGGPPVVEAAVNKFYIKVLRNPQICQFFDSKNIDSLEKKLRLFMTLALGGNVDTNLEKMIQAHAPLIRKGLNARHIEIWIELMEKSLRELDVPEELVCETVDICHMYKDKILIALALYPTSSLRAKNLGQLK